MSENVTRPIVSPFIRTLPNKISLPKDPFVTLSSAILSDQLIFYTRPSVAPNFERFFVTCEFLIPFQALIYLLQNVCGPHVGQPVVLVGLKIDESRTDTITIGSF